MTTHDPQGAARARYVVLVYDCAGQREEWTCVDFAHCVAVAGTLAKHYPRDVVRACNLDNVDLNFDGLTEDERDEVGEAIDAARTPPTKSTDGGTP